MSIRWYNVPIAIQGTARVEAESDEEAARIADGILDSQPTVLIVEGEHTLECTDNLELEPEGTIIVRNKIEREV